MRRSILTLVLLLVVSVLATVAPAPVAAAGRTLGPGEPVDLVGNERGDLALLSSGEYGLLSARLRPAGGVWSGPVALGSTRGVIGIDAAGTVTVATNAGGGVRIHTASGGVWEEPTDLLNTSSIAEPALAVSAAGAVVVGMWSEQGIHAAYRPAGGNWGEPVVWSHRSRPEANVPGTIPEVAIDAAGRAAVVWSGRGQSPLSGSSWLEHAGFDADGLSSAPTRLSEPTPATVAQNPDYLDVAMSDAGDLVVVWREEDDEGRRSLWSRVREADGTLGEPRPLRAPDGAEWTVAGAVWAAAGRDELVTGWYSTRHDGERTRSQLVVTRRVGHGPWSGPRTLYTQDDDPWLGQQLFPMDAGGFTASYLAGSTLRARRLWVDGGESSGPETIVVRPESTWRPGEFEGIRYYQPPSGGDAHTVFGSHGVEGGVYPPSAHLYHRVVDQTPPSARMLEPAAVRLAARRTVDVAWTGTDHLSGVASYDVLVRAASHRGSFGPWQVWHRATSATRGVLTGVRGTTYCFAVRASDTSGNTGAASAELCEAVPLDDRDLKRSKGWRSTRDTRAYEQTLTTTSRRGAVLSVPVTGRRAVVVARGCRACGRAVISLDGRKLGHLQLRGRPRVIRKALSLPVTSGSPRILKIRVVSRNRPVGIDAVGVAPH